MYEDEMDFLEEEAFEAGYFISDDEYEEMLNETSLSELEEWEEEGLESGAPGTRVVDPRSYVIIMRAAARLEALAVASCGESCKFDPAVDELPKIEIKFFESVGSAVVRVDLDDLTVYDPGALAVLAEDAFKLEIYPWGYDKIRVALLFADVYIH